MPCAQKNQKGAPFSPSGLVLGFSIPCASDHVSLCHTASLEFPLQATIWSLVLPVSTQLTGALAIELGVENAEHTQGQRGESSQDAAHLQLRVGGWPSMT